MAQKEAAAVSENSETELLNTFWSNYNHKRTATGSNEEYIWLELFLFHLQQCQSSSIASFEKNFPHSSSISKALSNIFMFLNLAASYDYEAKKIRTLILLTLHKIGMREVDEMFAISIVRRLKSMSEIGISDTEYLLKFPILCPSIKLLNSSTKYSNAISPKSSNPSENCFLQQNNIESRVLEYEDYLTDEFKEFCDVKIDDKIEFLAVLSTLHQILMIQGVDEKENYLFTTECLKISVDGITDHTCKNCNSELIWIDILSMVLQNVYAKEMSLMHNIQMKDVVKGLIIKHTDSRRNASTLVYYSYHLFTIINNTFFVENEQENGKNGFGDFYLEIESRKELFLELYRNITENNPEMSAKVINLWIEIYVNFKEIEVKQIKQLQRKQSANKKYSQSHHLHKQQPYRKFICFLECLLLHVLPNCMARHKGKILTTLKNIGICCCNCARWSIKILLDLSTNDKIATEVLIFARKQVISTIYRNSHCRLCFEKTSSQFADDDFVNMHRNAFVNISEDIFLPHLSKLAHLLPFSLQSRLLLDVLWPFFLQKCRKSNFENIDQCFKAICGYLKDPVLIKIFLTEDTLEYLIRMISIPKAFPYIYTILQNALLMDTEDEMRSLEKRILAIILENTRIVTQVLKIYMRKIYPHCMQSEEALRDLRENAIIKLLLSKSITVTHVLEMAVLQWRIINRLTESDFMQNNPEFYTPKDTFDFAQMILSFLLGISRTSEPNPLKDAKIETVPIYGKYFTLQTRKSFKVSEEQLTKKITIFAERYDLNYAKISSELMLNEQMDNINNLSFGEGKQSCTETINQEIKQNKAGSMLEKFNRFLFNGVIGFVNDQIDKNSHKSEMVEYENKLFDQLTVNEDAQRHIWAIFRAVLNTFVASHGKSDTDFKMLFALQELKKLILQHSLDTCNSMESAKAIVRALETILCVGESICEYEFVRKSTETLKRSEESGDDDFQTPSQSIDFDFDDDNASSYLTAEDRDTLCDSPSCDKFQIHVQSEEKSFAINENVCKVIVEILFEISELCIKNPSIWEDQLLRLFVKLRKVKHLEELTTFLIKGFSSILEFNDNRLIYLQNSILELIATLDTSEALAAYFKLFTAIDPPVELLLARLTSLSTAKRDINVLVEVNFPTTKDDLLPESDLIFYDSMQMLKMRASIIAPLDSVAFTPWKTQGFTVSLWMILKEFPSVEKMQDIRNSRDNKQLKSNQNTTHIFTIGTSKLLLSIHLDNADPSLLHIQLIKPSKAVIHESLDVHKVRSNCPAGMQSMLNLTKSALRNNWAFIQRDSDQGDFRAACIQTSINVNLPLRQWTFFTFSVIPNDSGIIIDITVNCKEKYNAIIFAEEIHKSIKNSNISLLAVGDSQFSQKNTLQRVKYSITNLMLFREVIFEPPILASFMSLGPNCNNLISGQIGNSIPNFGFINPLSFKTHLHISVNESIRLLREHLILTFSAENPSIVMEYITNCNIGTPLHITMKNNACQAERVNSFYCAIMQTGGLSSLLFLFARVVEVTDNSRLQAAALRILLNVAHSNVELYTEFIKGEYLNKIGSVLKSSKCCKDFLILQCFMDTAFDKPIMYEKVDGSFGLTSNNSYLIYPELVIFIITYYRDWHTESGRVLEFTLRILKSLASRMSKDFNIRQMMNVDILPNLINFCKVFFVGVSPPINITMKSAKLIVQIISGFGPTPPSTSFIDEIAKLLLLLHEPSYTYVTQDRGNYYYLLSKATPSPPRFNQIVRTAERIKTKFHFQRKRNSSPYNAIKRKVRSVSMDCLCPDTEYYERGSQKENFQETLSEIVDLAKSDSRINKVSMKDVTKLGKNMQIEKILKSKRTLRKSISYNRSSFELGIKTSPLIQSKANLRSPLTASGTSAVKDKPSVAVVQRELLKLLQNFIVIMPDNAIADVLSHYVTFQLLLILANNPSGDVRAEIVTLLANLCDRMPQERISQHFKSNYFSHLANQISIYPANYTLMMSCRKLAACLPECAKQKHRIGVVLLIAILPQLLHAHEHSLKSSLLTICNIYEKYEDDRSFYIESGLIPSLVKCVIALYVEQSHVDFARGIAYHVLFTIYYLSKMFLTAHDVKHLQYLWNLLNYMDYTERESSSEVVRQGVRAAQARIINGLLNACQQKYKTRRIIRSIIYIRGCSLSVPEMRSRFQNLLERSIMFLQSKDSRHELQNEENELVRSIIRLGLVGRMKIGSMIIWSLCPSRGVDLKFFIIRCLSYLMKSKHVITFGFNLSLIRTLANHFHSVVSEMPGLVSTSQFIMLSKFVKFIGGSNSASSADVEKVTLRIDEISKGLDITHLPEIERSIHEFESIALSCVETSLKVTRTYSELQNTERRNLLNQMRCEKTSNFNWKYFISQMTHEGTPFYNERFNKVSWEMDDTEGPSRVRLRLRRCNLTMAERFLLPEAREKYKNISRHLPLQYLIESLEREKNALSDQVLYNFSSAYITADSEFPGDLVVTETMIKFFPDDESQEIIIVEIANILDIWLRRYEHHNKAIELFTVSGRSLFFVLRELNDRKIFAKYFSDKICDSSNTKWHYFMLQQWRDGQLTNWEYLTALNQLSGRSYQHLMQYPVFPWILADYQSSVLDLTNPNIYRKLEKPIAIQHPESEEHFKELYEYLAQPGNRNVSHFPYHYSSHYSNSGTVLSFMIRIPPFTSMFIKYQDNNFDLPDRTFFSVRHAWRLASKDSPTDVKELIPEFFSLPEMFENSEDFDFGVRQSGERVNHVTLPPWSNNSSRLFVLIHRQALESDYVRSRLHLWIDLIFGYKQTGKAAVAALNVFHSATYPEFPEPASTDPVDRSAYTTMIKTYGQMPKQVIAFPHPPATKSDQICDYQTSFATCTVKGLKWGIYTGSPQLPIPECVAIYQQVEVQLSKIICMETTNAAYGLSCYENYMQGIEIDTFYCITWKHEDNIVRIRSIGEDISYAKPLFQSSNFDPITSCGTHINSNQLWFGHQSGRIVVYQCSDFIPEKLNKTRYLMHSPLANTMSYNSAFRMCKSSGTLGRKINETIGKQIRDVGNLKWKKSTTLLFHDGEVTGISLCVEFKVAVSIGKDGKTAIWDTNTLEYIRQIPPPNTSSQLPITLAAISPTLGDIVTIHCNENMSGEALSDTEVEVDDESYEVTESNIDDFVKISMNLTGKTLLRVHTVNASYVSHIMLNENILSVCYSNVKEGTGINVIATGLERGIVKLWSSWDLNLIREIDTQMTDVVDISYSTYQHLIVLTRDNIIQVWESPCLLGNAPKFPQSIFRNSQWRIL
ncbi:lysosomal-trafficking regulator [Phlebotomus argentipes]|uniref:lysosomal-trafficking regulator n=1 Tax=Phlebotomus argentipes TaxID=94469 RepID=UPI0028932ADE|nr:lysosomal-trafficking regulator [Phlebotomus argentipes]